VYLSAALCGAVLLVNLLEYEGRVLHRCFSWAPLHYTGRISYGLYLYNDAVSRLLHHNLPGASWWLITPLLLIGSYACAALSYRYAEARFLRSGGGKGRRTRPGSARPPIEPKAPAPAPAPIPAPTPDAGY
jgi:peptidoglycan/LPS O-acetylase OafA/YrhL